MRAVLLLACLAIGCDRAGVIFPRFASEALVGPDEICCEDAVTVVSIDIPDRDPDSLYYVRVDADDSVGVLIRNSLGGKDFGAGNPDIKGGSYEGLPGSPLSIEIRPGGCSSETRAVEVEVIQERLDEPLNSQFRVQHVETKSIPIVECDPPGAPRPGPGTLVYDSPVDDPQIPYVVEAWLSNPGPVAVLPGGGPADGALGIVDVATGNLLSTFLAAGFGNPQQFLAILWHDPTAPADMTYGIETLDLRAAWFNRGWGLAQFKSQASDLNVLGYDEYGYAEYYIRTIPGTRQVQYVEPGNVTTSFSPFNLPAGLVPVSAEHDDKTDLWYLLLIDPDDNDRTFLYVSDGSSFAPVKETGFGGISVRFTDNALVVAHEESERVSVFKRGTDDVFAHALDIDDAGPVRSILVRRNGDNTVLAWANGTNIRIVVIDADCNLKVDETFAPPVGMDRVNALAWHGLNGLYGTGALGSRGKCFSMADYVDELGLDECARFPVAWFDPEAR